MAVKKTIEQQQIFLKDDALQLSHGVKNIYQNRLYQYRTYYRESFLWLLILKICESFFSDRVKTF